MTPQGGADVSLVGERPKVLLVSAFSWTTAGRLAVAALDEAGFVVDAVGPSNSIIHGLDAVRHGHRLSLTRPLRSIARAIEEETRSSSSRPTTRRGRL